MDSFNFGVFSRWLVGRCTCSPHYVLPVFFFFYAIDYLKLGRDFTCRICSFVRCCSGFCRRKDRYMDKARLTVHRGLFPHSPTVFAFSLSFWQRSFTSLFNGPCLTGHFFTFFAFTPFHDESIFQWFVLLHVVKKS